MEDELQKTLSSIDKNLALLNQSLNAHIEIFKDHVVEDNELKKDVADIKSKMARYAGGLAVLMVVLGIVIKLIK